MAPARNVKAVIGPEVTINAPISPSVDPNAPRDGFPALGAPTPVASQRVVERRPKCHGDCSVVSEAALLHPSPQSRIEICLLFPYMGPRSPTLGAVYYFILM